MYRGKRKTEMPPHIFSITDNAYRDMLQGILESEREREKEREKRRERERENERERTRERERERERERVGGRYVCVYERGISVCQCYK